MSSTFDGNTGRHLSGLPLSSVQHSTSQSGAQDTEPHV